MYPCQWDDVIADSAVWTALTAFLIRNNRENRADVCLQFGGGPLANYWLTSRNENLRRTVVSWLERNWRSEWDRLTDETKRAVTEHFAERTVHLEGLKAGIRLNTRAFPQRDPKDNVGD